MCTRLTWNNSVLHVWRTLARLHRSLTANSWTECDRANLAEFVEEYSCFPNQVEDDGEYEGSVTVEISYALGWNHNLKSEISVEIRNHGLKSEITVWNQKSRRKLKSRTRLSLVSDPSGEYWLFIYAYKQHINRNNEFYCRWWQCDRWLHW